MQQLYRVAITGSSAAEANRDAADLEAALRQASEDLEVNREKADTTSMDLGSIIAVLVTSGAGLAFAKGIADWLRRHQGAKLTVKNAKGEVVVENVTSADVVRLVEIFRGP